MLDQQPFLISMAEAARRLGISHSALYEQEQKGNAPFVILVGGRKKVSTVRLEKYLHGQVISPDLVSYAMPDATAAS